MARNPLDAGNRKYGARMPGDTVARTPRLNQADKKAWRAEHYLHMRAVKETIYKRQLSGGQVNIQNIPRQLGKNLSRQMLEAFWRQMGLAPVVRSAADYRMYRMQECLHRASENERARIRAERKQHPPIHVIAKSLALTRVNVLTIMAMIPDSDPWFVEKTSDVLLRGASVDVYFSTPIDAPPWLGTYDGGRFMHRNTVRAARMLGMKGKITWRRLRELP